MKYKSYAQIANEIEITYCDSWDECYSTFSEARHASGWVDDEMDILHWDERRVTRSGIRRFLMLAWTLKPILPPGIDLLPSWLRLWLQITWVRNRAKIDLHTSIPAHYWNEDKARLAAKISMSHDRKWEDEKKKALRWALR